MPDFCLCITTWMFSQVQKILHKEQDSVSLAVFAALAGEG